jgi:hypothetical protein
VHIGTEVLVKTWQPAEEVFEANVDSVLRVARVAIGNLLKNGAGFRSFSS